MKLLILGGTGVISRAVVAKALEAGHEVTAFNRGTKKIGFEKDIRIIVGDRRDEEDFRRKMAQVECDVAIDMIAFDEHDALGTLDALRGRAGQFIITSSTAAYKRPNKTFPTREDAEELCDDPSFPYAIKKANMERALWQVIARGDTAPITIIRPSLTFGRGCANMGMLRQNHNVAARIRAGKPLIVSGDGTTPWCYTFAPDLAQGYVLLCGNPKAYGQAFGITSGQLVCWEELYTTLADVIGKSVELRHVATPSLMRADPQLFAHIEYEKKFAAFYSNDKIKAAAPEYSPKISLREGLADLLAWWDEEGFPVDEEKDAMEDKLCALQADFDARLEAAFRK